MRSIKIQASVYVCDILDQLSDDDLKDEVSARGLDAPLEIKGDLEAIETALLAHKPAEALAIVERLLRPKWRSIEHCQKQYSSEAAKIVGNG